MQGSQVSYITRGSKDSLLYYSNKSINIDPFEVTTKDTIGAGDA
ncbi:PfkB family carbohydrate kinase [Natranaerobius trueperi]